MNQFFFGAAQLSRDSLGSPMRLQLLLLVAMAAPTTPVRAQMDTLTDADLVLAGVHIGSSRQAILQQLGHPTASSSHRLTYPGLAVLFGEDGKCDEIVVTLPRWVTARGLRVGDSTPRIAALYGGWAAMRDSAYVLYERSTAFENELGIQVLLRRGRVVEIDVGSVISHS